MIMHTRRCITPLLMAIEGASAQAQPTMTRDSRSIVAGGQ
jgi:hypothetical protein